MSLTLHAYSFLGHSTVSSQHIWHLRAFSVAGPTVWNTLPDLLQDPSVESENFRRDFRFVELRQGV